MGDTMDSIPTLDSTVTTLARGRLTLMLVPTPLARSTMAFPSPMLLPLVMPTTPDMLPTLPSLPIPLLDTMYTMDSTDTMDSADTTVPTLVKQHKENNNHIKWLS